MGDNNAVRSEQLGMSFGKATQRLRKMILFMLVRETGKDFCFKCGEEISDIDHLSIEHKLPWQGRDTALFWDLSNIAFSHLKCNIPHRSGSPKLRKIGPTGTLWCSSCVEFKPEGMFGKNSLRWNGMSDRCNPCHAAYKKEARSSGKTW